jgi:hypothetical protein
MKSPLLSPISCKIIEILCKNPSVLPYLRPMNNANFDYLTVLFREKRRLRENSFH